MKIYVASSWRNNHQPLVVLALRKAGHEVYDFKNPELGNNGFHWSEIDEKWGEWEAKDLKENLEHPLAVAHFTLDMNALKGCDACVLVLPSGRSAHLEAGWAVGAGKPTLVYSHPEEHVEPELMYKMTIGLFTHLDDVILTLSKIQKGIL